MKKVLIITIFVCTILLFIKYWFFNYNISYNVDGYNIITNYKNSRFYFEIEKNNTKYNFDVYKKRSLSKTKIKDIKYINGESFSCIYPIIENIETYPLCYADNQYIDYNLIDSELLSEYKKETVNVDKKQKDFLYYNNLSKNEYIALWNYKGYIIMNGNTYDYVNLFSKDRYDNSLSYLLDDTLYVANYDEEHEYTKLITLDIKTKKKGSLELGYTLDYDSYIVGNIKNKLYIFDNKYSVLYEINVRNGKVKILSNNEKGYVKYQNGEFVTCSKSDYKVNKIKYNNNESKYKYSIDSAVYKIINDNKKIIQKINNNIVNIIKEKDNNLYYSYKDNFYIYEPLYGENIIFYNYELEFNNNNTIFIYFIN